MLFPGPFQVGAVFHDVLPAAVFISAEGALSIFVILDVCQLTFVPPGERSYVLYDGSVFFIVS